MTTKMPGSIIAVFRSTAYSEKLPYICLGCLHPRSKPCLLPSSNLVRRRYTSTTTTTTTRKAPSQPQAKKKAPPPARLNTRTNVPSNVTPKSEPLSPIRLNDRVNPPSSTLPAPLTVPSREPNQAFIRYALNCGKAYIAFYKAGIKNIWANRKACQALNQRVQTFHRTNAARKQEVDWRDVVTRAEFQLLRRNRANMARVPIFALMFVIFGEWLPLIVVFCTPVVPPVCRIPGQVEKARTKLEKRRQLSFRGAVDEFIPSPNAVDEKTAKVEGMGRGMLQHIGRSLDLHVGVWDYFARLPLPLPPTGLVRRQVKAGLAYLEMDDKMMARDGGAEGLTTEEVRISCQERGFDTSNVEVGELRETLRTWLKRRKDEGNVGVLKMLMSR